MKKRKTTAPGFQWLAVGIFLLAAVALLVIILGGRKKNPDREAAVQEAVAYLAQLEQQDPGEVKKIRNEIYLHRAEEQKQELISLMKTGDLDPFPLFQDYVVLGDSRAIGFYYNEFLQEDRILADGGNTILAIKGRLKALKKINPSYVFLCYGLNDISIGYWDDPEEHAKDYMGYIRKIQETLPEATIVVSSILPTTKKADSTSKRWRNIPQWNEALKAACEENGILFADCSWIYDKYHKLWVADGYHFRPAVYPHWGSHLVLTALYGEINDEI